MKKEEMIISKKEVQKFTESLVSDGFGYGSTTENIAISASGGGDGGGGGGGCCCCCCCCGGASDLEK